MNPHSAIWQIISYTYIAIVNTLNFFQVDIDEMFCCL